jgi:hypothetical protein
MTTQPSAEAVQEIVAEMQFLLGVADESPEAEVIGSLKGLND